MNYPCLIWLLALAFLPLALVALIQRPPLTSFGRIFYAVAGVLGIATGGHWLFHLALSHGLWPRNGSPPKPLLDVVHGMAKGRGIDTWLALLFLALGVASCIWSAFGPEHRDEE